MHVKKGLIGLGRQHCNTTRNCPNNGNHGLGHEAPLLCHYFGFLSELVTHVFFGCALGCTEGYAGQPVVRSTKGAGWEELELAAFSLASTAALTLAHSVWTTLPHLLRQAAFLQNL